MWFRCFLRRPGALWLGLWVMVYPASSSHISGGGVGGLFAARRQDAGVLVRLSRLHQLPQESQGSQGAPRHQPEWAPSGKGFAEGWCLGVSPRPARRFMGWEMLGSSDSRGGGLPPVASLQETL